MKRIETFVFEFDNHEAFVKFWTEYCRLDKESNNGVKWISAAIGNQIERNDHLEDLIGRLYEPKRSISTLQEAEDLLGI